MEVAQLQRAPRSVILMNGESVEYMEVCTCNVKVENQIVQLDCIVSKVVPGFGILLGMDAVNQLGGVLVRDGGRTVVFGSEAEGRTTVAVAIDRVVIDDPDFHASFSDGRWEVRWEWLRQGEEPLLRNSVEQYAMEKDVEEEFSKEIEEWITNGWLQLYSGHHGGIVPLMAVVQGNKDKVRPVIGLPRA